MLKYKAFLQKAGQGFHQTSAEARAQLCLFIEALPDNVAQDNLFRRHTNTRAGNPNEEDRFVDLLRIDLP